ncbi:MAG TPA: sugar phosphate isomerase/epimerase family protein [Terriglobia bacterium]|nr:sugar phosphate isomerase/epimerase family protein [Terriglobia bacterium]
MTTRNRRRFLQASAALMAQGLMPRATAQPGKRGMRLGLIIGVQKDPDAAIAKVHSLGLPTCQASLTDFSPDMVTRLKNALEKYGVEATAINTSGPGPDVYDFYQGPLTIGLVPREYRQQRIDHLKRASDFARQVGVPAIHSHFGFMPENPNNPAYTEAVAACRDVVQHVKENNQMVLYETGQETPITLLRLIKDVGLDNQGVNLDTANLILYGKGNPLDALDVIGHYVHGMHAKDGLFPTDPRQLGEEVPIGKGKVDFPLLFKRLKELNYHGPVTIEREISGPQQMEDIKKEITYLRKLIG